jgi:o-succinylbenzoate synthase
MQIAAAGLIAYLLPCAAPWISAAGALRERHGWLVRLTDRQGRNGYGDAAPLPAAGTEPAIRTRTWLDARLPALIGRTPQQAQRELTAHGGHPAARCGLETALLDLQARQQGMPLYRLLGAETVRPVRLNAALGSLDDGVEQRLRAALATGYRLFKLKLGTAPAARELAHLERLCQALPAGCQLRLDANRAWRHPEARQWIERLNELPVESLEEPLRSADAAELQTLQDSARFDLALDESLPAYLADQQLQPLPVRRIIIKPACLGGPTPALAVIRQAHRDGIACVVTSTLESSAGIWPLCHLAATADSLTTPTAHGLATADWFARDLGNAPVIRDGQVALGPESGTGFILR